MFNSNFIYEKKIYCIFLKYFYFILNKTDFYFILDYMIIYTFSNLNERERPLNSYFIIYYQIGK